ncbi:hypothetical protein ACFPOU_05735 [Massilia jejuensis]|uniref:Double-GTPase 1 domain-containing protein n=1 Tax=Massilia jejuensis TaxID=648894 RepID=A0ABW0PDA0_9BURK
MDKPKMVLLGGPNSGKTHYAGQLYGRLRRRPGRLRLAEGGTPVDLSPLEDVLASLEEGRAAEHTSASTWAEITLPIVDDTGTEFELNWPDYGGEQLRTAFNERAISELWRTRLKGAQGWILMIRLKTEVTYPGAIERMVERSHTNEQGSSRATNWDSNAYWTELTQILLHVGGLGTVEQKHLPRLAIMLSCYDEVNAGEVPPATILARYLPLFSTFLHSVWPSDAVSVWGLSSLGRELNRRSHDDAFIDNGPETQGWTVLPAGGPSSQDLTLPLHWLLQSK